MIKQFESNSFYWKKRRVKFKFVYNNIGCPKKHDKPYDLKVVFDFKNKLRQVEF